MRKSATQRWDESESNRVRVLLECPPAESPSIIASAIERRGYAVRTCEGPSVKPCALLDHGACALVDGADVVVNMLGSTPGEVPVLPAVAALRRCPAMVVEVWPRVRVDDDGQDVTVAPGPAGAIVEVAGPMTTRSLFGGIEDALQRREQRIAWWGEGFC